MSEERFITKCNYVGGSEVPTKYAVLEEAQQGWLEEAEKDLSSDFMIVCLSVLF